MDKTQREAREPQRVDEVSYGDDQATTATRDRLDRYRTPGSAEDAVRRTSGQYEQPERVEFRRHAQQRLSGVISSLENGRDQMKALHAMAKQGYGPGTREYDQTFDQAKQAYFQAIKQASTMLYDTDANGRMTPNQFYRATEQERQRLQQEMTATRTRNPAEYQRLSQEYAMLGDVLRANGYANANFGLALIRTSVYLPREQRDQQTEQGNKMLQVAAAHDPWMLGDPPRVAADPNFLKHRDAIVRAINATPYIDGTNPVVPPRTDVVPPPRDGRVIGPRPGPFLPPRDVPDPILPPGGGKVDPPAPAPATELARLKAQLTQQEKDVSLQMEAARRDPRNPLNKYSLDLQRLENQKKALADQITNLGRAGTPDQQRALGYMWDNCQTVQDYRNLLSTRDPNLTATAQLIKSHPKFAEINAAFGQMLNTKVQIGAVQEQIKNSPATRMFYEKQQAIEATRRKIAELERAQAAPPVTGTDKDKPPIVPNPGTDTGTERRTDVPTTAPEVKVEIPPQLAAKVQGLSDLEKAMQGSANAFAEVQALQKQGPLKDVPPQVRAFFGQANGILSKFPPDKLAEAVDAQRQIHQLRLDAMVPKADQPAITQRLTALNAEVAKAEAALTPAGKEAMTNWERQTQSDKDQLQAKYLKADPEFQRELQTVVSITQPNSAQRNTYLKQLNDKYVPKVERNQQYQKELQALNAQAETRVPNDPTVTALMAARKAKQDFLAGKEGPSTQTEQERIVRARNAGLVDMFMTATKNLDQLSHAAAIVQGYQARVLVLSPKAQDHQKALELISASAQDPGAAQYLTSAADAGMADKIVTAADAQVHTASAPLPALGFAGNYVVGNGLAARGLAGFTDGRVFSGRLEAQSAATVQLADSLALDPATTRLRVAAAAAPGQAAGNGLLRDGGSLAAYGATHYGLGLLKYGGKALPAPLKIAAAALMAAGVSDYLEDEKLDGPFKDPGAWARGGGVGLGGHAAYKSLLGEWSHATLAKATEARIAALGGEAALTTPAPWKVQAQNTVKETAAALATRSNFLGTNPLVTEANIAAADAAQILAIRHNLQAMQYYRTVQTAFAVGAGHETLKIADGETKVDGIVDGTKKVFTSGAQSAVVSGLVAPALTAGPRIGLSRISGLNPILSSQEAAAVYAFSRTTASEVIKAGTEFSISQDLLAAQAAAQDPQKLADAYCRLNPKMSEAQAQAKAAIEIQMRRGQDALKQQAGR